MGVETVFASLRRVGLNLETLISNYKPFKIGKETLATYNKEASRQLNEKYFCFVSVQALKNIIPYVSWTYSFKCMNFPCWTLERVWNVSNTL